MRFIRGLAHVLPRRLALPILLFTVFSIQFGLSLGDLPMTKVVQDIICLRAGVVPEALAKLGPGYIPEILCHGQNVQSRLNAVSIGLAVSKTVGMILAALPFGSLADRIGRVPVLLTVALGMLAMQAYILAVLRSWATVPVQALWAAGSFLLIGGGRGIAEAIVFTIIADMSLEKNRATHFQWVASSVLLAQLVAQPSASGMMRADPWLPLYLSLVFILAGALIALLCLPETKNWARVPYFPTTATHLDESPRRPWLESRVATATSGSSREDSGKHASRATATATATATVTAASGPAPPPQLAKPSVRAALACLHHREVCLLLPGTAFSIPLVSSQIELLFRLMPILYGWTLSASALLVSLRSGVTIIVIAGCLPLVKYLLLRRRTTRAETATVATTPDNNNDKTISLRQDHRLALVSANIVFVGSLLTMMVWSVVPVLIGVVLSSLGAGVPMLCRSLIVDAVRSRGLDSSIGALFSSFAIIEAVAYITFLLGFGALFDVGLGQGSWAGWSFFAAVIVAGIIATCLWVAKLPGAKTSKAQEEVETVPATGRAEASTAESRIEAVV